MIVWFLTYQNNVCLLFGVRRWAQTLLVIVVVMSRLLSKKEPIRNVCHTAQGHYNRFSLSFKIIISVYCLYNLPLWWCYVLFSFWWFAYHKPLVKEMLWYCYSLCQTQEDTVLCSNVGKPISTGFLCVLSLHQYTCFRGGKQVTVRLLYSMVYWFFT